MPNEITTASFNELSPQQREDRRSRIAFRAKAILGQFWNDDIPDAMQALELEGWADVLENCSEAEIRAAWTDYQKNGPRTRAGRLCKPDAGALYRIILNSRPRPRMVIEDIPPRIEPTEEEKAAVAAIVDRYTKGLRFGGKK